MFKRSLFFSTILLQTFTFAANQVAADKCGYAIDPFKEELLEPKQKIQECTQYTTKEQNLFFIQKIDNYQQLFEKIDTSYSLEFFNNRIHQKLLNDVHINQYTITFLVYQENTLFKIKPKNPKDSTKSYIFTIKSGGKHLILYHILPGSKLDYQKVKKILQRSVKDWEKFKLTLQKIAKKYPLFIKDLYSKNLFIPAQEYDLNSSFQAIKSFPKKVKKYLSPYHYEIAYSKQELKQIKKIKNNIQKLLELYNFHNNFYYYRHHEDEFPLQDKKKTQELQTLKEKSHKSLLLVRQNPNKLLNSELNLTTPSSFALPYQYKASKKKSIITLPQISITLKDKKDLLYLRKIDPNKKLKLLLETRVDIQHQGSILRRINTLSAQSSFMKEKVQSKETNILYDTYVNFPGLQFSGLTNNYGSITFSTTLDKYEKNVTLEGTGIIKKATCGYKILKSGKIDLFCKKITYRSIHLLLEHKE